MKGKNDRCFVIHSPNWLGDAVMFLPAWRAWRNAHPTASVAVVAKKRVVSLWRLVGDVDRLIVLDDGWQGMRAAAAALRDFSSGRELLAICAPQSLRSAWLLLRGGAARIRGTCGQFRFLFVRDRVSLNDLKSAHQSREYARIMDVEGAPLPPPSAAIDFTRLPNVDSLGIGSDSIAVLPGAARGSSKRWPADFFAEVATKAVECNLAARIVICGTPGERQECDDVQLHLEKRGIPTDNLCAKTAVAELAAVLVKCRAVLTNDSGGMHLATAVGTPVVAVFGLTDPAKTGPLGNALAVAAEGVRHSRAIPRDSPAATTALRSVSPNRVFDALESLLVGMHTDQ